MADEHEHIERPATWENIVVGKAKEALGRVVGDPDLAEEGAEQEDVARDVHDEFEEQQDVAHEGNDGVDELRDAQA